MFIFLLFKGYHALSLDTNNYTQFLIIKEKEETLFCPSLIYHYLLSDRNRVQVMPTEEKDNMYIAYTIIGFINSHIPFLNHFQTKVEKHLQS